ncbi:MAG: serine/threonine-protein kinase [Planctomycetes bacterium]|nr:serine/threonine-protein kinase [Planctomycetota bacterium]
MPQATSRGPGAADEPDEQPRGSAGGPDVDDPVEELMARCLDAAPAERASVVERLSREHPEHAEELRRRLAVLAGLGVRAIDAGSSASGGEQPLGDGVPERLGEFRLIERLGAGGMGVVYRAEQTSLGREVALKLVRPELVFFGGTRERFRREVEAIAKLKHPGIVPVFAVGEERGLPYFAMELVDGCSLGDVLAMLGGREPGSLSGKDLADALERRGFAVELREGSIFAGTWVAACLALARDVAAALAHAHSHGLVHRDVKPSNVLVTADGRARLLDFGLASVADDVRMTRTGTQPGTPLYMAPEQVRGERVDPRADVYGLGVTLHELLALEPRFQGRDASALRAAIEHGDARPLVERNPRVPRDVDAVVRVATDREPARRYPDATLFARDLEHALAGRPVLARPPSGWVSFARWVRRHPTLTTASGLGLLLLVGVPLALYFQQKQHADELAESLDREHAARVDSDAAADFLFNMVLAATPERLRGRPFELATWIDGALEELDRQPYAPDFVQRLLMFGGEALTSVGKLDRAIEVLRRADAIEVDGAHALAGWEGRIKSNLATALQQQARFDEAEVLFREALAIYLAAKPRVAAAVAVARNNLAVLLIQRGKPADAEPELAAAIEGYLSLGEPYAASLAVARINRSQLLADLGRAADAVAESDAALALLRSLPDANATYVPTVLNNRSLAKRALGDLAGARADGEAALAEYERLYPGPHASKAKARYNLGVTLEAQRELRAAHDAVERAHAEMLEVGLAEHPDTRRFAERLAALAEKLDAEK